MKSSYLILVLVMVIAVPFSGYATDPKQDGQGENGNKENATKEDSVTIFEDETKGNDQHYDYTPIVPSAKDSEVSAKGDYKPYVPKPQEDEKLDAEVDPNSAMSFNFIYYIIDKFKFTDPLD